MKMALLLLQFSQLGVHEAMMREVPYAVGAARKGRADAIKGTALGFNLVSSALLVTVFLTAVFLIPSQKPLSARLPWITVACILPLSQLYWYVHVRLRAEAKFREVSLALGGLALSSTAVGVLAAQWFGLQGFLLALGISYLLVLAWCAIACLAIARPRWNGRLLRELLRTGFPIMASGGLLILLWNVDKLMIWLLLSPDSLGLYALPTYAVMSVLLVPESVSAVLYPRLMEEVARADSPAVLERYLTRPTLIISYVICPLLGLLFLGLHLPIRWFLPMYLPSIPPGKVLIAMVFFMAITRIPYILLLARKQQKQLVVLTALSAAVGALGVGCFLSSGAGLEGAAKGMAVGFIFYSCVITAAALRGMQMRPRRILSLLSAMLLPYFVTICTVSVVLVWIPEHQHTVGSDLAYTTLRAIPVLITGGLVVWLANRKLGFLSPQGLGVAGGRLVNHG